ncbi:hypothetical protein ACE1BL_04675 [Aeromonas allosaccharophila]
MGNNAEVTLNTHADTSPESIKRMLDTFSAEFGVTTEQVQTYLGRRADTMQPAQYVQMCKIYASLRDGMSKPGDWFKSKEEEALPEKSRALNAMRQESSPAKAMETKRTTEELIQPEEAEPHHPIDTREQVDHSSAYADHCAAIEAASDTVEWQQAYTSAWAWASETGDHAIADGIKQVAGERKAQLKKVK